MDDFELSKKALEISGSNPLKCMKCGKCAAFCPSDDMEYYPHRFVDLILKNRIGELSSSKSIYKCLSCLMCAEVCPRGVNPVNLIESVRNLKIRQKNEGEITADAGEFLDSPPQLFMSAFRKYTK